MLPVVYQPTKLNPGVHWSQVGYPTLVKTFEGPGVSLVRLQVALEVNGTLAKQFLGSKKHPAALLS